MLYTLASLPSDHLEAILAFVDASAVCCLLLCGDGVLNSHIKRAVTRLEVVLRSFSNVKFPRFFSRFPRLLEVSVGTFPSTVSIAVPEVDLSILGCSLKSLTIGLTNGLDAFLTVSRPEALGALIPQHCECFFVDLNALFPNLTYLSCSDPAVQPKGLWMLSVAKLLPRGLESLKLRVSPGFHPDDLACLPTTLARMSVIWNWNEREAQVARDPFLPPELVSLELTQPNWCANLLPYLPQTLTELNYTPDGYQNDTID